MRSPTRWPTRTKRLLVAVVLAMTARGLAAAAEAPGTGEPAAPPAEGQAPPPKRGGRDYRPFPTPDSGYVTDLAGLLTDEQEEHIERWLWQVESRTRVEIIVVTLGSLQDYPDTPNRSIEAFATALFNAYGIGNLPRNDGVLLLVARNDRKVRIELGKGYGHARDADASRIIQKVIVPRFKQDDYAGGITEGVRALMREFAGVRVGVNWKLIGLIVAIPVVGLIAVSLFRSGKRGWGWVCVGLGVVVVLAATRLVVEAARHAPEGDSSDWGGGGLGGFGGGSSGGGGATGSW